NSSGTGKLLYLWTGRAPGLSPSVEEETARSNADSFPRTARFAPAGARPAALSRGRCGQSVACDRLDSDGETMGEDGTDYSQPWRAGHLPKNLSSNAGTGRQRRALSPSVGGTTAWL